MAPTKKRVRASPLSTPSPSPAKRAKWTQLALDVGQRDVAASKCPTCGMVYASGVDDDAHDKFHREFGRALRFTSASARAAGGPAFVTEDGSTKMYVVDATSSKAEVAARQAARNALGASTVMASELGRAVLAVRDSEIVGYCAFRRVDEAQVAAVKKDGTVVGVGKFIKKALCGVQMLWVRPDMRRLGLANDMVRTARRFAAYAHMFARHHVAFTAPTPAGARFALKCAMQRVRIRGRKEDDGKAKESSTVSGYILVFNDQEKDDAVEANSSTAEVAQRT